MNKRTKLDVIREFISDLENVVKKVNDASDNQADHNNLRDYFLMAGIKESTVNSIYTDCGFNGSSEFVQDRRKPKQFHRGNVSCTISKINGLSEAVIEVLNCEIAKELNRC